MLFTQRDSGWDVHWSHCFINGRIFRLLICGIILTWLNRSQSKVFLLRFIGENKQTNWWTRKVQTLKSIIFVKCQIIKIKCSFSLETNMEMFSYPISSSYFCVEDSWDKTLLPSNKQRKKQISEKKERQKWFPKWKLQRQRRNWVRVCGNICCCQIGKLRQFCVSLNNQFSKRDPENFVMQNCDWVRWRLPLELASTY